MLQSLLTSSSQIGAGKHIDNLFSVEFTTNPHDIHCSIPPFSVISFPCPHIERCQAFFGLLSVLHENPDVLFGSKTNIYSLLIACVSWSEMPPQEVCDGISGVFYHLQQNDQALWNKVLMTFSNSYSIDGLRQFYRF
jgi:hypothetical protein